MLLRFAGKGGTDDRHDGNRNAGYERFVRSTRPRFEAMFVIMYGGRGERRRPPGRNETRFFEH